MATIFSFGYKLNGEDQFATTGRAAPVIWDCRVIDNPHHDQKLRRLTGKDKAVQRMVENNQFGQIIIQEAVEFLRENPDRSVAFGCSYGKHRSVACAEIVAKRIAGAKVIHTGAVAQGRNA